MADLWATNEQQRDISYRLMAQQLIDRGALKADIPVDEAADVIYAMLSLEAYLLFIVSRKWAPERWQQWTTRSLTAALLR